MANERTFLAWLRTSLSMITIGIGIVQLFKLHLKGEKTDMAGLGKFIGSGFFVVGVSCLIIGCYRYFKVQSMLLNLHFPASQYSVVALVISVFVLFFLTIVIVSSQR